MRRIYINLERRAGGRAGGERFNVRCPHIHVHVMYVGKYTQQQCQVHSCSSASKKVSGNILSYSTVDKFKTANLTLGTVRPKLATGKAIPLSYNKACIDVI